MKLLKAILIPVLMAFLLSSCANSEPVVESKPVVKEEAAQTEVTPADTEPVVTVSLPPPIADCVETEIAGKFFRLWALDDPEMPAEEYAIGKEIVLKLPDGMFLYTEHIGDRFLASDVFAVGNPVQLCLVSLPTDCPPGDDRGKEYSLLDRRTGFGGVYVDAWHLCGGA